MCGDNWLGIYTPQSGEFQIDEETGEVTPHGEAILAYSGAFFPRENAR
jgi:hypothetical protein